jgi:hypothetical protein
MDAVQSGLRNMVVKKMESKSFGQNRMAVCQGQIKSAIFIKM